MHTNSIMVKCGGRNKSPGLQSRTKVNNIWQLALLSVLTLLSPKVTKLALLKKSVINNTPVILRAFGCSFSSSFGS